MYIVYVGNHSIVLNNEHLSRRLLKKKLIR